MADFKGWARTNFFRVRKSKQAEFLQWARWMELEVCNRDGTKANREYCLMANTGQGWPSYDPRADGDEASNFAQQISRFLTPASIAIMIEAGAEGMAYVGGNAVAVDHKGNTVSVSLADAIQNLARQRWPGRKITSPSYG